MSEPIFTPAGITPSAEQLAIQTARARHLLIEANAGAAKTTTLALRMAQALQRGAQPRMLLALTYTEPAVQALQAQLRLIGVQETLLRELRIQTFEQFAADCLAELEGAGMLQLRQEEELRPYVLEAIAQAQLRPQERHREALAVGGASEALIEGLLQSFAVLKGRLLLEREPLEQTLSPELAEELGSDYFTLRVFGAYEMLRRGEETERPLFRFTGDAVYDLARLLLDQDLAEEGGVLAQGLALIAVDEMHDTHRAMFTVLQALLARNRRAAFVGVGDRDQVIHGQAGAEAGFMGAIFEQEIGPALRLPLSASHRFGAGLAQAAGRLARKPYAAVAGRETEIQCLPAENVRVQARLLAVAAREHLQQQDRQTLRILLRRPAQSLLIERELLKLGVPYQLQGLPPFLRRREILLLRGLHAHARGVYAGFEHDAGLRRDTLAALLLFAGAQVQSDALRGLDAHRAQRQALEAAAAHPQGMHDFIEGQVLRNASGLARPRLQASLDLLRAGDLPAWAAGLMGALEPERLAGAVLVRREDIRQVRDHLEQLLQLALGEEQDLDGFFALLHSLEWVQAPRAAGAAGRVSLSTIAAAKGLEFDHVLLPHLSRGEFVGEGSADENRNLLYVALTRARQRLSLAFNPQTPSRYLIDAGLIQG